MPKFIYGFEFEGVVLKDDYVAFCAGLKDLHKDMLIDVDSSITIVPVGYRAIEFSTKKMVQNKAFALLDEILSYLWIVSQENIFLTNSTCGFHVNMSEEKIFKMGKQLEFYSNIVWKFKENEFLKKFKRLSSDYCRPFKDTNKCQSVEDVLKKIQYLDEIAPQIGYFNRVPQNKKYYAIAMRENPDNQKQKNTRIEFRFMGNKDYHLREKPLTEALSHIITVSNDSLIPV